MPPVERQPVRRVGARGTVRAHPVQPAQPAGDRVRAAAGARRGGLHGGRPGRPVASDASGAVAGAGVARAGPRVDGRRGTGVPGGRAAAARLQVVPDHADRAAAARLRRRTGAGRGRQVCPPSQDRRSDRRRRPGNYRCRCKSRRAARGLSPREIDSYIKQSTWEKCSQPLHEFLCIIL